MQVKQAMTRRPEAVDAGASVRDVAQKMRKLNVGAIPVMEKGKLCGMITDRDLVIRGLADGANIAQQPIREFMSAKPVFCSENEALEDAIRLMEKNQIRRLPVMDQDQHLAGILSLGDISLQAPLELSGEALRAISRPSQPSKVVAA